MSEAREALIVESKILRTIGLVIATLGAMVIAVLFTWWLRTDILRNVNLYEVNRKVMEVSEEVKATNRRLTLLETRFASMEKKLSSSK